MGGYKGHRLPAPWSSPSTLVGLHQVWRGPRAGEVGADDEGVLAILCAGTLVVRVWLEKRDGESVCLDVRV